MTEQPKTTDPADAVAALDTRLKQLDGELATVKDTNQALRLQVEKQELTIKKLQAERDRLRAKQEEPRPTPRGAVQEPDLREFANEKAREALKLRLLMDSGLKEEDLEEGVEYASPGELRMAIEVAKMNKKIAEQDQQLTNLRDAAKAPPAPPASGPVVDTGGPTSVAPAKKGKTSADLRTEAEALRKTGRPQDLERARWLVLQASHRDPTKILGRARGGATEEG